ncbi:hypothetical protein R1sor_015079 [Riccia sorocarpa]|uniref:Photosystem I reaction center subunit II, chloroplastic n=1 Tax=Riccia sorocarpa TaxID=122646 RepID=A0ABD3HB83_9MARC
MASLACTSAVAAAVAPVAKLENGSSNVARSLAMAPFRSSSLHGQKLATVCSAARVTMKATPVPDSTKAPEAPAGFTPPELNPDTPSPIFGGSTGGLLRKAQVEEFYVITWESPKEQIFEMPTGGAAIMRSGPNLLKLARKEQCLALGTALRSKFKLKYQFYRVFPNGEVQYLHPKDGVYPEKVNPGRTAVGFNARSIGKNKNPVEVKNGQTPITESLELFERLLVYQFPVAPV